MPVCSNVSREKLGRGSDALTIVSRTGAGAARTTGLGLGAVAGAAAGASGREGVATGGAAGAGAGMLPPMGAGDSRLCANAGVAKLSAAAAQSASRVAEANVMTVIPMAAFLPRNVAKASHKAESRADVAAMQRIEHGAKTRQQAFRTSHAPIHLQSITSLHFD